MARIGVLLITLALMRAAVADPMPVSIDPILDRWGMSLLPHPGPDGKYDPADFPPTGGLAVADLTSGGLVTADMIPAGDGGAMMMEFAETTAARISEPAPVGDLTVPPHQSLLEWPNMPEPAQMPVDTALNMAAETAQHLDTTSGVTVVGGQIDGVFSQISGDTQAVFSTLPIPGVADILGGQ
jgi:hypothetical protein